MTSVITPADEALLLEAESSLRVFTIDEVAVLLRVPKNWVQDKVTARAVPHTRIGKHVRFTRDHVQQILKAGEQTVQVRARHIGGPRTRL